MATLDRMPFTRTYQFIDMAEGATIRGKYWELDILELKVFQYMFTKYLFHSGSNREYYESQKAISDSTLVSPSKVKRSISKFVEIGLIQKEKPHPRRCVYVLPSETDVIDIFIPKSNKKTTPQPAKKITQQKLVPPKSESPIYYGEEDDDCPF